MVSLLFMHNWCNSFNSGLITGINEFKSLDSINTLVPSAYSIGFKRVRTSLKLFTYIKKSAEPNIDPCNSVISFYKL